MRKLVLSDHDGLLYKGKIVPSAGIITDIAIEALRRAPARTLPAGICYGLAALGAVEFDQYRASELMSKMLGKLGVGDEAMEAILLSLDGSVPEAIAALEAQRDQYTRVGILSSSPKGWIERLHEGRFDLVIGSSPEAPVRRPEDKAKILDCLACEYDSVVYEGHSRLELARIGRRLESANVKLRLVK